MNYFDFTVGDRERLKNSVEDKKRFTDLISITTRSYLDLNKLNLTEDEITESFEKNLGYNYIDFYKDREHLGRLFNTVLSNHFRKHPEKLRELFTVGIEDNGKVFLDTKIIPALDYNYDHIDNEKDIDFLFENTRIKEMFTKESFKEMFTGREGWLLSTDLLSSSFCDYATFYDIIVDDGTMESVLEVKDDDFSFTSDIFTGFKFPFTVNNTNYALFFWEWED